jgi:putative transposase
MMKAYTFRIYPKKKQEITMIRTLDTCRHLYNSSLADRIEQSRINTLEREMQVFPWGLPEWITYEDQAKNLTDTKTHFQEEVHAQVLQNTLKRLDTSFKNFYNGFGYPRFRGRNRYDTFTYPQSGFKINGMHVYLSKIGNIRMFQHRPIEGKIKTCTVKKDVDQWYVIFTCDLGEKKDKIPVKSKTGIDVGLESLMMFSNGERVEPPKFYRKSEKKLAKEQRKLSHKKKGSQNRKKQIIKVDKVHQHIRNQRKDFNHKASHDIIETYDHIVFEDLQIQNMVKNHCLAKSIMDAGWGQIIRFTAYKAAYAGKTVELVDPYYTSQTCLCGAKVPKTLKVRVHVCPECGLILNRDHVSAILIERKGSLDVPTDCGELKPTKRSHEALHDVGSPWL